MKNNALGTLKYDITAGALSLVVAPMASGSFNLPDAPTDAAFIIPTYGRPIERLILADRLDLSQAKYEIVLASKREAEAGGAYTYTIAAGGRGAEGTTAQAWTAANTIYVFQASTAETLANPMLNAILRAQHTLVHARDALVSWDGTTFKFSKFRAAGVGRGLHAGSAGTIDIDMPANGTAATGVGGAANINAASGGWPLAEATALYYEPNIAGAAASLANNFRVVGNTTDYVVPPHWIFIAGHLVTAAGEKILRVGNGATLFPWQAAPAFTNAWVNFGAPYFDAAFRKNAEGMVELRGAIKTGTIGLAAFTLAAGYRPGNTMRFAVESNGAYGCVEITNAGVVTPQVGNNTRVNLDGIRFLAEA